ncbi:hypothetical protein Tco_1347130 [Tanacetum coccineum]
MSGSEPGEMAPEGSRAVVLPKFDMHIYTSKLTPSELKAAVSEYCIPLDLHPRLPHSGMTMNRLSSRYIGLYIEQLEQGLRIPFSSFFLAVIRHFGVHVSQLVSMGVNRGHWFSFQNKTRRDTKKCFKERHGDTDLHDDFPTTYSESDAARLSEFLVPLRSPPRHLLYVCGLTTACRHPELQYNINDQDKNGKEESTNLAKAKAKRVGAEAAGGTLSTTPLHQATPEVAKKPATVVSETSSHVEKEVVDLSVHSQSSHQGELLKRHEQLNCNYVDLRNCNDAHLLELDHLRSSVQRADQDNEGLTNKLALLESAHSGCESWEKELMDGLKYLERERDEWRATASNQVEKIRGLEKDLEPKTHRLEAAEEKIRVLESEKLALSTELTRAEADRGWDSAWEKHQELFTKQYPYVQKVADSYLLPMADLLQVSPDVPTPPLVTETGVPSVEGTNDATLKSPPPIQENVEDILFGTTTWDHHLMPLLAYYVLRSCNRIRFGTNSSD